MNSKGKGIITAVIVVLIALAAFCGFGYISQRMTASEGITYLDKKEYQKAYEQFDHAAGKFTLIFTKQKKDVLFYSCSNNNFHLYSLLKVYYTLFLYF